MRGPPAGMKVLVSGNMALSAVLNCFEVLIGSMNLHITFIPFQR